MKEKFCMDEAKKDYVRAWMKKSLRDLESAARLAEGDDPFFDTAIYHCQQSGEKAVKGYLAFMDHPLVRTHDVEELAEIALSYNPLFSRWIEAGKQLTPLATAYRYPAEELEPTVEKYQQAKEAADGIYDFICSLLPLELRT
jgi:HEPN domain-containing protein